MNTFRRIISNKAAFVFILILVAIIVVGIFAPLIAPHDPIETDTSLKYAAPSLEYPLGNDNLGRCVLSRLIHGIRPSILFVMGALLLTLVLGVTLGLIAGYFGGTADAVIMRICDAMLSFPSEVMTLALVGMLGVGMGNILLAYIILKWAWYARMVRSAVMQYRDSNYIQFSKASGSSNLHSIFAHILPSVMSEIIVISSSSISSMILLVSGFSFLGLGIQAPNPEWGMMLNEAKEVMYTHPFQMIPPGAAVMAMSLITALLSDNLRDVLDPQHTLKEERG